MTPQTNFKTSIIQRFLKGKEFNDFVRSYNQSKFSEGRNTYTPTKEHEALFDKFLAMQITLQDVADKMGTTLTTARSRFATIAFKRLSK